MDRVYAESRYTTEFFDDTKGGCAGLKLFKQYVHKDFAAIAGDEVRHVATVTYWDAVGDFTVETHGTDLSATIVQELINEAKERIRTK